jgi:hypothetical protein
MLRFSRLCKKGTKIRHFGQVKTFPHAKLGGIGKKI